MLNKPLSETLLTLRWFYRAGIGPDQPIDPFKLRVVFLTELQMTKNYASDRWEDAIDGAGNKMFNYLLAEYPYVCPSEWDALAGEATEFFDTELFDLFNGFAAKFKLTSDFVELSRIVIISFFLTEHFRYTGIDTAFYDEVLFWYKSGRFPCAWIGEWPAGRLGVW